MMNPMSAEMDRRKREDKKINFQGKNTINKKKKKTSDQSGERFGSHAYK